MFGHSEHRAIKISKGQIKTDVSLKHWLNCCVGPTGEANPAFLRGSAPDLRRKVRSGRGVGRRGGWGFQLQATGPREAWILPAHELTNPLKPSINQLYTAGSLCTRAQIHVLFLPAGGPWAAVLAQPGHWGLRAIRCRPQIHPEASSCPNSAHSPRDWHYIYIYTVRTLHK